MSDSDDGPDELPTKRRRMEKPSSQPQETNSIGFKLPHGSRGGGQAISRIKNKCKRTQLYQESKHVAKKAKAKARRARQKEHEMLGADAPPKQEPRTLDNTREKDDTMVGDDEEVMEDEKMDEFASYFSGAPSKIMITSNFAKRPSVFCHTFIEDLMAVFPCLLYTSDAADEEDSVDLGGRRIIKKKKGK
eukprot:TRINITY_DN19422_c0_g1_i1.p1 TRINITY_DN19422_c0_g1~~TRINITY_DN19422_c0_g1_i1.p1  ORF type:complete len:190 (-),score=57.84 TRINITY_DN19422_c0_g1_i1:93-662(-)